VQFSNGFLAVFGSPDSCWLMRTGAYILATSSIPQHDLYSWTCPDRPWVLYQWLFELVLGILQKYGKIWGTGYVGYALAGLILLYILPRDWLKKGVPLWQTLLVLTLAFNDVWFFLRPQIASFLFICLFLNKLEDFRRGKAAQGIYLLPLYMILWVNLHSFWFIGLIALICYALFLRERKLWYILLLSTLAIFVNPYGSQIITYNFSFVTDADRGIAELRSPFLIGDWQCCSFGIYLLVCWTALLRNLNKVPPAGLLLALITSIMACYAARFMPVAILGSWFYLGLALSDRPRQKEARKSLLNSAPVATLHLILSLLLPLLLWSRALSAEEAASRLLCQGQYDGLYFLAQHEVAKERLYNDESLGSRLLFYDVCKVFIDNRFDMYGKNFVDHWFVVHYAEPGWQNYLRSYKVSAVAISEKMDLHNAIFTDTEWLLAYDDKMLSYWLKDSSENRARLRRWHLTPELLRQAGLKPEIYKDMLERMDHRFLKLREKGKDLEKQNKFADAAIVYDQLVFMRPHNREAHQNLIHSLALSGSRAGLEAELRYARPYFWTLPGEKTGPADETLQISDSDNKKINSWVVDASRQLLSKYSADVKHQAK
jgi:hypothetical protein